MSDMNELLNNITNTEITKKELERELETLSKEYKMECDELRRLNDKNVEYSSALKEQERDKQLKNDREKSEQAKANLNAFVNELGQSFKRWYYEVLSDNIIKFIYAKHK